MGWIWVVLIAGLLMGSAALVDHRKYRGLPVPPGLSGRAKRRAVRESRVRVAHLEMPARHSGYIGGGDAAGSDGGGN
jgi:hypothetical protein